MKLKKIMALLLIMSLFVLAGCGNSKPADQNTQQNAQPAASGSKIVLRLGHVLQPDNPYQLSSQEFAKIVKEKSNGQIEVQIFPQSQLGAEVQLIQALRTGTVEMGIVSQAPFENTVKEWAIFDIPYMFDNLDQARKVLDGPAGQKYLDMLPQHNIIGLSWLSVLERNMFTAKKPINSVADLKGLKIRVMQSPGYINAYKGFGANPTPLAYNELYLALQQGVVDGGETDPLQFTQDKFAEVCKNYILTHSHYLPVALLISKATFDKLTPDQQKIIKDAAKAAAEFNKTIYKKQYDENLANLKTKGINVTSVDVKPFIEATAHVKDTVLPSVPNGEALYKELMDAKK